MKGEKISADAAAKELEDKSHLNRLQIRKVIGGADHVSQSLITAIIKISESTERELRSQKPAVRYQSPALRAKRPAPGKQRLKISVAKEVIVGFAENEAL